MTERPDPPVAVPGPADPVVSPADTPAAEFPDSTPRPWYFDGWDIFTSSSSAGPRGDGHRMVIPLKAINDTFHPSQRVSDDDARLIVQAVNERAALLAVGERDRRQIARLTEALERIASPRYIGNRDSTKEFVRAVLAGEEDARPTVEPDERITWVDVRPGDAISLLVMSTQFGLQREVRSVVAVDWPKITLAEGARCYEIDATKPDNLDRAIERTPRAAGGGDT